MKKLFILGAIVVLALASCSKDVVVSENRDADVIGYNVVTDVATKAANVYCANAMPKSFKVWANLSESNSPFIVGEAVNKSDDAWKPAVNRYWPNNETTKLDFFATVGNAAPAVTTGEAVFDYTVLTDVAAQEDILYAANLEQTKADGAVEMNFRHALSQIVFKVKNTNKNLHVFVDGIKVGNVYDQGTFTFGTESTTTNVKEHEDIASTPALNGVVTVAKKEGDDTDSSYKLEDLTKVELKGDSSVKDLTYVKDGDNTNAMILMPQTTEKWDKDTKKNGSYLAVKCSIFNVADPDGAGYQKDTDAALYGTSAATAWATLPIAFNWEPGKKYVYTIVFSDFNGGIGGGEEPDPDDPDPVLVPISYTVTVDDFQYVDAGEHTMVI